MSHPLEAGSGGGWDRLGTVCGSPLYKAWDDITLKEQLNVIVDSLAKLSLVSAVLNDDFFPISSLFPFEQVCVHLGAEVYF